MRWKRLILGFLIGVGLLTAGYVVMERSTLLYTATGDFAIDSLQRHEKEIEKPAMLYGMVVNDLHIVEDVVKRNQRFSNLLEGFHIQPTALRSISQVPRQVFDFRKISAGKKYTLVVEHDSLKTVRALIYEASPIDYYIFHLKDSMRIEAGHRSVLTLEKEVAGVIGSSLSETVEHLGISHELTNRFVDIFAWQIDFQQLQKGDRFKLFYEEKQVEGQPVGIGKIKGIYFEHRNFPYYAIPFDQGNGLDFFDQNGKSLHKALLKYPIEFTRISSRYNLRRFHPIAKVVRAHRGTDFAAPYGTPIRSVGDGTGRKHDTTGTTEIL